MVYPNEFDNEKNSDMRLYNQCSYMLIIDNMEQSKIERSHSRLLTIGLPILGLSILLGAIGE